MPGGRPRVLVIDDKPNVRDLWVEFARACGCDVEAAVNGEEGLGHFAAGAYDIVVTDLLMPGVNGDVVVRTVRQADPGVGVILITGSVSEPDGELRRQPGVTLLRKPVTLADFRVAIEGCLARRAGR